MCLIFLKPKSAKNYLTYERFCNALENNPHSVGIVYKNPSDGKVKIERFVHPEKGKEKIYDIIKDKEEYAIHFRYATHGGVNLANCHPFIVNSDLCLMHNGVMSDFGKIDESKSDTKNFTECFLRPYIEQEGIGVIKDKEFIEDVGKVIGAYNKLLLIDKDFNWSIINESSGVWKEGCWLSNSYSTESSRNYYDCYSYGNYYNNSSKYNYHKDYKYYDNYSKSYNDWDDDDDYWDNYYNSKYNHEENKKKFNEVFGGDEKTELQKKLEADPFGSYDVETGEVFVD